MCFICCHVRINGTPSGSGVHQGSRDHHGTSRSTKGCHRIRRTEGGVQTDTGGIDAGGAVLPANPGGTHDLQGSTANHRPTAADHGRTNEADPAPAVRPYRVRATDTDSDEWMGRGQKETCSTRDGRGPSTRTGGYDPGCTTIWRGSPQFEDAVSECLDIASQSGPSCSTCSERQRSDVSRLPRHFRVGSISVERLDCSTSNGNTTQTRHLSRRTVQDAVRIQLPEENSLRTDLATCPGGRNDRAGRPTSFYKTPGSSFWGPWPSSHHWTKNAGD